MAEEQEMFSNPVDGADNTDHIYGKEASRIKITDARDHSNAVTFKAFLKSFNDSYTSNWNETTVYARMDPIYTFQNTTRVINFEIDIPAYDVHEAVKNLKHLSKLVRMLYPTYTSVKTGTLMTAAPVVAIKFGNLIDDSSGNSQIGLYGILSGITVNPVTDAGFFTGHNAESGINIAPKLHTLTCEFKPLHSHVVGHDDSTDFIQFPYKTDEVASITTSAQSLIEGESGGAADDILEALEANIFGGG